jgi:hypothetical protein
MPVFISLGENCLVDAVLKKFRLKAESFPFGSSRSNIEYIHQILESDFKDFLDPQYLKEGTYYGQEVVFNVRYTFENQIFDQSVTNGFEFTHHKVLSQEGRESVERKVERLRGLLNEGTRVVFIYHYRYNKNQDPEKIKKLLDAFLKMLNSRYRGNFRCILFYQAVQKSKPMVICTIFNKQLLCAKFVSSRPWNGDDNWDGRSDDILFRNFLTSWKFKLFSYSLFKLPGYYIKQVKRKIK